MYELIALKEAKLRHLKFYFTGQSCKRGHIELRLTSTRNCHKCFLINANLKRVENRNLIKDRDKIYYKKNSKVKIALAKAWASNNKNKRAEITKRYRTKNKAFYSAYSANRRAMKLKATPKWVNKKDLELIYKNCPNGLEVDHVIPLKSKLVCGLHTPENLAYLSRTKNAEKHNKFISYVERNGKKKFLI